MFSTRLFLLLLSLLISPSAFTQESNVQKLEDYVLNLENFNNSNTHRLREVFLDRKVVGLGEATHGTKEFFQLKGEMIKFLVSQLNFRVVVFEAFFADSEQINDYVLYGKGNPYKAIIGMGYSIWYTQEVYDLIQWLKEYNANKPEEEKVSIYGCDMTAPQITSKKLKAFLASENLLNEQLSIDLEWLGSRPVKRKYSKEEREIIESIIQGLERAFEQIPKEKLDQNKKIVHYKRILNQSADFLLTNNGYVQSNKRDLYMAENVKAIANLENHKKIVIWAHNAHITKGAGHDKLIPMGKHLKKDYGEEYYALGFGFNKGSFLAANKNTGRTEIITVEDAEKGSSDLLLAEIAYSNFLLDFKKIQTSFNSSIPLLSKRTISRHIGFAYYPKEFNRNYRKHILEESYDGLIFVRQTNAAKMLDLNLIK